MSWQYEYIVDDILHQFISDIKTTGIIYIIWILTMTNHWYLRKCVIVGKPLSEPIMSHLDAICTRHYTEKVKCIIIDWAATDQGITKELYHMKSLYKIYLVMIFLLFSILVGWDECYDISGISVNIL